jgi:hypothetical protein
MTNTAFKQASYQDILDLPENIIGEIINGHLETHPRPAPKPALAASSLRCRRMNCATGIGCWPALMPTTSQ